MYNSEVKLHMVDSVAFAGLGAVGAIYAQLAARCKQVPCFAIVRDRLSYENCPVSVNGEELDIPMVTPSESKTAGLIIVAVKWHTLEDAIGQIAPFVREGTIILSLLNGIRSEGMIAQRFPNAHVLTALCSGIDSNRQGRAVRMNRRGRIVFGSPTGEDAVAVREAAAYFDLAGIPYEVPDDVMREMWWKLMVNVGINQVSAVMGLNYGEFRDNAAAMARMHRAQREVIAVAQAQGIALGQADIERWDAQLAGLSDTGLSSTLQDVRARRKTEVELYGGEICRQGERLGIPTPENALLIREICELERKYLPAC